MGTPHQNIEQSNCLFVAFKNFPVHHVNEKKNRGIKNHEKTMIIMQSRSSEQIVHCCLLF